MKKRKGRRRNPLRDRIANLESRLLATQCMRDQAVQSWLEAKAALEELRTAYKLLAARPSA